MTNLDRQFNFAWVIALCLIAFLLPVTALAQEEGQEENRAGLVVIHGDGTTVQRCISFSEPEISGLQVLERSGLDLNYDPGNSMGAAICRIDGEGCSFPQEDCYCQCQEPPCFFWSYWYRMDGEWTFSPLGAASRKVKDGNAEAWVWSEGTISNNAERQPPADLTYDQICDGEKDADVIVQFGDSDAVIRPIEFRGDISGLDALELSGLDVVTTTTGFGPAVCSIDGVGCPADDCFCRTEYWGYNRWDGEAWLGYMVGADTSVISQTGSVEGWIWGEYGDVMSPATNAQAASDALIWIRSTQVITDGGFGTIGVSVEAAMAIGANRENASDWRVTNPSSMNFSTLAGYLLANGPRYALTDPAASGKVATAAASTNTCMPAGLATPATYYDPSIGAYSEHNGFNAWAMIGALAAGEDVPSEAVQSLIDAQKTNGGWEWMESFGTDTNTTSLAIQALIGAGQSISSTEVIGGLAFLKSAQNDDGGFTYDPASAFGTDSDANSTAYSTQAIWAAGQNPMAPEWTSVNDSTPIDFLLSLQLPDGSFEWQSGSGTNVSSTQQAIPALLGRPFPIGDGLEACFTFYVPGAVIQ